MQVQCVLCDKVDQLEDHSFQAKTLRNHKIKLYLCRTCYDRIDKKTKERHATGNFRLYRSNEKKDRFLKGD
ncbi:MAG TPA: YlaI family protein [Bacillota bacterium]|nr:YlaI family protein [Bacillota bacterium]